MSTSNQELDQVMRKSLKLFHSTHPNSAVELRMMIDEMIKQRYGPEKMLCNILSQHHLDMEKNFPGMRTTPPEEEEIINLTGESPTKTISDSLEDSEDGLRIAGADDEGLLAGGEDDGNLKEFCDLNCCICGEMMFTATNRLIECSKCGTMYHQECHKPPITDAEASEGQEHNWQCDNCYNKPSTSKAAGVVVIPDEPISLIAKTKSATSSRSSSTSNSSSPFYKLQQQESQASTSAPAVPASYSKHHHKSSSHKAHRDERPSSSKAVSHSTSERSTHSHTSSSSKSKSSSHSSTKSSSKSSRHHESSTSSSSSKRKSNK